MTTPAEGFPEADIEKEVNNPALNKNFQVDPVSSDIETAKKIQEEKYKAAAAARKEEEEKDAALHNFKTTIIISGIIIAVAGAVFAITKRLRDK